MCAGVAKVKFSVELLFKLDGSFHIITPKDETVGVWEAGGVSFVALKEQFDPSTALGRPLMNLLTSMAEFDPELETDGERRQGTKVGRPRVTDRIGFDRNFGDILERLNGESISRRQAAIELGIGYATLKRLLDSGYLVAGPE